MSTAGGKPRAGRRWMLWAGLACFLVFALLTAYHFIFRPKFVPDAALLEELQGATLLDPPTASDEWPGWLGPRRDGVAAARLAAWPEGGPPVLWRAITGPGFASVAVAGGRACTVYQDGNEEAVLCWDAADGRELWRFAYPANYHSKEGSGPRATPSVDGDRVYTVGATGLLHCLDAAGGKKLWAHDLLKEHNAPNLRWGVSFSPLVDGDLVYTMPGGPGGNGIAAFHKDDGALAWKALDDAAGYSSPLAITAAGRRQVLFFTAVNLVSLAPEDGRVLWSYPWPTQFGVNAATPVWFQAAAGGRTLDYVFVSSAYNKGCALLKVSADGVQQVYSSNQLRNHFATSVRVGECLYGLDGMDSGNHLVCLEIKTGKVRWRQRGFGRGTLIAADGRLLVLGEDGRLTRVTATPEAYREEAAFQALDGKCWSAPALAGGRLYVRDETKLLCFDLRGQ